MPDLSRRATESELLDAGVPEDETARSLADLRFVNRWLGGRRALLRAVRPLLGGGTTLLDVGCGSADLPAFLAHACGGGVVPIGVDLKRLHLRFAPGSVRRVVADVRALPFRPDSVDVVTASLFLHHFDAVELPGVLAALYRVARRALVVNDLRRAAVPYWFGALTFPLLFRSQVSLYDGLLSIRRSFTDDELRAAFEAAGITRVRLWRSFPYRLVAVAPKAA